MDAPRVTLPYPTLLGGTGATPVEFGKRQLSFPWNFSAEPCNFLPFPAVAFLFALNLCENTMLLVCYFRIKNGLPERKTDSEPRSSVFLVVCVQSSQRSVAIFWGACNEPIRPVAA